MRSFVRVLPKQEVMGEGSKRDGYSTVVITVQVVFYRSVFIVQVFMYKKFPVVMTWIRIYILQREWKCLYADEHG